MKTSCSVTRDAEMNWWKLMTRLRCVSITPLGRPVVPLEYGSAIMSSPRTSTSGACVGAFVMQQQAKGDSLGIVGDRLAARDHHMLQVGRLAARRPHQRQQLALDENRLCLAVLQLIGDLTLLIRRVHRAEHQPQHARRHPADHDTPGG